MVAIVAVCFWRSYLFKRSLPSVLTFSTSCVTLLRSAISELLLGKHISVSVVGPFLLHPGPNKLYGR